MADEGLLLGADNQKLRRELAKQHKAAFVAPPTGQNEVWHWSPTANQHDAITRVEHFTTAHPELDHVRTPAHPRFSQPEILPTTSRI